MSLDSILLLTTEFPPQPGGIGNHAFHLAKGLQKHGRSVTVICDARSKAGKEEAIFDANLDFKVIRISRKRLLLRTFIKRIQTAFIQNKKNKTVLASGKFSLWLAAFLSLFFNRQYVAIIHGKEVQLSNSILKYFTDRSLKRFDTVIAVSRYTKSLVARLELKNSIVIPNGFAIEKRSDEISKKSFAPSLITVGNVTERKGQHNVINALPLLLKTYPKLKYHIVGIPTEKKKLEVLVSQLGVAKAVIFHGRVTEKEKKRLLEKADIFIMLSEMTSTGDVEGFGIAILEANALGLPAIGAKGCGIEDAVKDKYSGKLIDSKDPVQLKNALHEILSNYEEYSKGAKTWSENFRWDIIIMKYIKTLENKQ